MAIVFKMRHMKLRSLTVFIAEVLVWSLSLVPVKFLLHTESLEAAVCQCNPAWCALLLSLVEEFVSSERCV